ncbi:hypothetical protein CDAR_253651 [Caerostris darwini]|uniref:Uncharacterized protein n=1 Tax=Caerostris darwini TaxID=1538125 RepID=A0AAV4Q755_9ARAC|nr:hypothetical protein CDAR_253651 [Caerostris darwini]
MHTPAELLMILLKVRSNIIIDGLDMRDLIPSVRMQWDGNCALPFFTPGRLDDKQHDRQPRQHAKGPQPNHTSAAQWLFNVKMTLFVERCALPQGRRSGKSGFREDLEAKNIPNL